MDFGFISSTSKEETIDFASVASTSVENGRENYGAFGVVDAGIVNPSTEHQPSSPATNKSKRDKPECILTVIAPDMVNLPPSMVHEEWEPFSARKDGNTITVHLHLLLVSMLNRLIRGETLPREAIHLDADETSGTSTVQVLIPRALLPVLMTECERLGIGKYVGLVYASRLETLSMPSPGSTPDPLIVAQPQVVQRAMRRRSSRAASLLSVSVVSNDDISFVSMDKQSVESSKPTSTTKTNNTSDDFSWTGDLASTDEEEKLLETKEHTKDETTKLLPQPPSSDSGQDGVNDAQKQDNVLKIVEARRAWLEHVSRVRDEQIAEDVAEYAGLSFDYILFVVCSSVVASFGLITDSSTYTLMSNLVSPIIGPVFGFSFGTAVQRRRLIRIGLLTELLSLFLCALVGSIFGASFSFWPSQYYHEWPSEEVLKRADLAGLVGEAMFALTLGVATALYSPSMDNKGLVGAAVSFSIVPPAVNAGICWTYALLLYLDLGMGRNANDDTDYWYAGDASLSITLVNVVALWIAGTLVVWLKRILRRRVGCKHGRQKRSGTSVVQAINAGLKAAAMDLTESTQHVHIQEFHLSGGSMRNATLSKQIKELVQARDILFDDALLTCDFREDETLYLPPDLAVDQDLLLKTFLEPTKF
mmetsp:Transcript_27556/g.75877  ORF Transcript_27556/g.75877 Transcript_27556/m.75877 type:complete len:647 (+) Transcript_27556:156-2096(+)|eukprot:CAMPEP_0168742118 /NCGR_PEP_ID=MMETSP0724-20121128/12871_1 /TAXON_ID=265536 /ORGANISM="Amphiprora sp., Strain CCMP467" /LENGTH=646 /DNA_ID=CAMNT_0008789657 /DNA_START=75 /DNA_END=2015 /DNA_ORIENTATION=-